MRKIELEIGPTLANLLNALIIVGVIIYAIERFV